MITTSTGVYILSGYNNIIDRFSPQVNMIISSTGVHVLSGYNTIIGRYSILTG